MRNLEKFLLAASGSSVLLIVLASCYLRPGQSLHPHADIRQIKTVVVIYAENRSFDHLFGRFPGAEGLADATDEQRTQLDRDGTPLATLPPVYKYGKAQEDYPSSLPNGPYAADRPPQPRALTMLDPDLTHGYYQHKAQINGGKNNRFVAESNAGALTMANYDGSKLKLWQWAKDFTLADHFFQASYGGSFVNHLRLVCACIAEQPDAPDNIRAQLDDRGALKVRPESPTSVMFGPPRVFDGRIAPRNAGSYTVNSSQPSFQPSSHAPAAGGDLAYADPAQMPLKPLTMKTIGDTLSAKGVTWAWYAQGWNAALADGMREPAAKRTVINFFGENGEGINFQTHHHPFNYYARFAPGSRDRAMHLRDRDDFVAAIEKGALPQVSFYKPAGRHNQHSGSSTIAAGDAEIHELLTRLRASPQWKNMAIIVTYDEYGGYWDHVPPPTGPGFSDEFGPGTRIPAIIISPFARRGHVDKTVYDTTSIQKFLNARFGLEPLPGLREKMGDLTHAFRFD